MELKKEKVGRIYVAQPSSGHGLARSYHALFLGSRKKYDGSLEIVLREESSCSLAFNWLWVDALNKQKAYDAGYSAKLNGFDRTDHPKAGTEKNYTNAWLTGWKDAEASKYKNITHFVMLREDIVPDENWLDVLMGDLIDYKVDIMAALVPLKEIAFGLTSVAIEDIHNSFEVERSLTFHEVFGLKKVFSLEDCGYTGRNLLTGLGCWACDFTKEWRFEDDKDGNLRVFFTTKDRIRKDPNSTSGMYQAQVEPLDWFFSREAGNVGAKLMITRNVGLVCVGEAPFTNKVSWGETYDSANAHKFGNKPIRPKVRSA